MFENRAEKYDRLQWVQDENYINTIINVCGLASDSIVCDVGTGTGIIAKHLSYYCKQVDAIDVSGKMIAEAKKKRHNSAISYKVHDIEHGLQRQYNCIVARMVFHHIKNDKIAAKNCINSLLPNGTFVVAEGIPHEGTEEWFEEMFKEKENRRTYTLQRLVSLMDSLDVCVYIYQQKNMSINNWLENAGISEIARQRIFNMHLSARPYIKKAYNMRLFDGDIIMNWRTAIVVGKCS